MKEGMMPRPIRRHPSARTGILPVVCLLVIALGSLLPHALGAQSFTARLYGQDDGLDNQAVVQLAQDPQGHLWIATENGLFRYDGSRFIDFGRERGLNDPRTYNIHIDRLGTLWVANREGLFYFDGDRFREVQIWGRAILVGINSSLASNSSAELLVASSNEGFLSIEKDPATGAWTALAYADRHPSFRLNAAIHGVTVDRNDRLWFACGTSICGFSPPAPGAQPEPVTTLDGVPPGEYDALLMQQEEQQHGRLWARSAKSIVTWLPGERKVSEVSSRIPGSQNTVYRNLIEDRLGNVLTPTTDGFATWDGTRWEETANTTAGEIDGATALLADQEGGLWIGTPGKGLLQALGYKDWVNYTLAQGLQSQLVFGIAVDKRRRLWLGNPRGIDIIPPGVSSPIASPLAKDPNARWIEHLLPTADGGMWAAALHGHLYLIGRDDRIEKRAEVPEDIKRVRLNAQGVLWVATRGGLYHLDCPLGRSVCDAIKLDGAFAGPGFPEAMQFDREGNLWVATGFGLFVVRNGRAARIPIARSDRNLDKGLTEIAIAPDGTIWVAGRFPGLVHVRVKLSSEEGPGGGTATILDTHASPELGSDYIEFLASDAKGRIWAGTDHGVNVLYNNRTTLINMQDGLIWNDTDWNAFLEDSDGSVWIGTSGGVSHLLDPDAVLNRTPFKAELDRPRYGRMSPGEQLLQPGSTTPWDRGTFVVGFTGLTFRDNRTLIYHYRMEGLDTLNIETHSNFARFQQLPPGTYNFVVVAEDRGHNTFSSPASFSFTLSPPWWRTRLCFALEGVGIVILILLLWRWSNQALLAQRERLQRLVAERTAELQKLAHTDALTGLLNRGAIMDTFASEAAAATKRKLPLCVAIVDLDHFKRINDTLGHLAGDEVLREAARRLASAVRTTDFVGRYGGEEFLVVFRDTHKEFGRERCEALRKAVCESPIRFEGHELSITASIGVAWTHSDIEAEDALVALADRALYTAKEKGRNCVEVASSEPETVLSSQ
jgi:diguanylate cyclase (GGDEF)-like protein